MISAVSVFDAATLKKLRDESVRVSDEKTGLPLERGQVANTIISPELAARAITMKYPVPGNAGGSGSSLGIAADRFLMGNAIWERRPGSSLRRVPARPKDDGIYLSNYYLSADGARVIEDIFRLTPTRHELASFDASTVREIGKIQVDNENFHLQVSADGRRALTIPFHNCATLWDLDNGQQIQKWEESKENKFHSFALSPDGRRVAATVKVDNMALVLDAVRSNRAAPAPFDGVALTLWDAQTGAKIYQSPPIEHFDLSSARGLSFSPDGRQIIACGKDSIKPHLTENNGEHWEEFLACLLWDADSGGLLHKWRHSDESSWSANVARDSAGNLQYLNERGHNYINLELAGFSPDVHMALSFLAEANSITIADVSSGAQLRTIELPGTDSRSHPTFLPVNRHLIVNLDDGSVSVLDVATGGHVVLRASRRTVQRKDWLVMTPDGFFDGPPREGGSGSRSAWAAGSMSCPSIGFSKTSTVRDSGTRFSEVNVRSPKSNSASRCPRR